MPQMTYEEEQANLQTILANRVATAPASTDALAGYLRQRFGLSDPPAWARPSLRPGRGMGAPLMLRRLPGSDVVLFGLGYSERTFDEEGPAVRLDRDSLTALRDACTKLLEEVPE